MKSVSSDQSLPVLTASSSASSKSFVALLFCLLTIILASATIASWSPPHVRSDAAQFETAQASPIIAFLKKAPLPHTRRTAEATPKVESSSRDDFVDSTLALETERASFYLLGSKPAVPSQPVIDIQRQAGPAIGSRAPPAFS